MTHIVQLMPPMQPTDTSPHPRRRPPLRLALACLTAAAALLPSGCVERTERLRIGADGAVVMQLEYSADKESELSPTRVPAEADGWRIERSTQLDEKGNVKKHLLTATRSFEAGEPLPDHFAAPDDPRAGTLLHFPTTVETERRGDAIFVHFRRLYPARPWAYVEDVKEGLLRKNGLEDLEGKDLEDLSHDERVRMLRSLVEFELEKKLVFARRAFLDATPNAPQDAWLAVRAAVLPVAGDLDYERLSRLVAADKPHDDELEAEATSFEQKSRDAMHEALITRSGYGPASLEAFEERYAWHEHLYDVTSGLAAETFRIEVEMPGAIVGANADEVEGGVATWKFGGADMRDRALELLVTSRVAPGAKR